MEIMQRPNKFFIRRMIALGSFLLISVVFLFLVTRCWTTRLPGKAQEQIISFAKVNVSPKRWVKDKHAIFKVSIESYENPAVLDLDLSKVALLVDEEDTAYKPKYWEVNAKKKNKVSGDLVFQVTGKRPKTLALIIFAGDEAQYHWSF